MRKGFSLSPPFVTVAELAAEISWPEAPTDDLKANNLSELITSLCAC